MKTINRRSFLATSTKGLGAVIALSQLPLELLANAPASGIPVGFQSWSVKDMLANDFSGTLKMMSGLGYKLVEMCYPKGYAKSGFGSLVDMNPKDIKRIINDAGLSCPSCHFGGGDLFDRTDECITFAKGLGLDAMVCSSFGLPKEATLNDWLAACDKLNKAGEKIKAAGMQAAFHNHESEFGMLDGKLVYDEMMGRLDADLVKMQFQTQVITLGYKASTYFTKYPGRFISAHLSDWTADKKEVPVGQGVIDWKEFFAAAKTGGVKYFYVEMAFDKFKDSATYIDAL
jgi:sugar phosphate isomerase/epimerase